MVRLGWGCGSEEEEANGPRSSKEGVSRATDHHSSPPSQSSGYPVCRHCRRGPAGGDRPSAGGRFAGQHCPSQGAPSAEGPRAPGQTSALGQTQAAPNVFPVKAHGWISESTGHTKDRSCGFSPWHFCTLPASLEGAFYPESARSSHSGSRSQ